MPIKTVVISDEPKAILAFRDKNQPGAAAPETEDCSIPEGETCE